jgi:hypothetical protein
MPALKDKVLAQGESAWPIHHPEKGAVIPK